MYFDKNKILEQNGWIKSVKFSNWACSLNRILEALCNISCKIELVPLGLSHGQKLKRVGANFLHEVNFTFTKFSVESYK